MTPEQVRKIGVETTIAGIPCLVVCTGYSPGRPGRLYGPPENCYEAEPDELEWEIYDRKGYLADWLAEKTTNEDEDRIYALLMAEIEEDGQ